MDLIPTWFKFPHCIIFIILVLLPYPIYQIIRNSMMQNSGVSHSKSGTTLKYSCMTKYFLLISVLLSYSYVITTSFQSSIMWISDNNNNKNGETISSSFVCPFLASYRMFSYVTGRVLLYCYFIYRTSDIFKGTYLEFSKCTKYCLLVWIIFIVSTLVVPSSYIYFSLQKWIITTDELGNGSYCKSDDNNADLIRYLFMWGSLNDITYSIITIFMMVSRLFMLLTDNERKKSRGKRYEFNSSKDDNKETVPVPQQSPPASPVGAMSSNVRMSFPDTAPAPSPPASPSIGPSNPYNNTSAPVSRQGTSQIELVMMDEMSKTHTITSSKSSRKLKKRVTVSKLDAIQFHDKTHGHNKLILLISKFFIILTAVVISSQFVLIMFIIFRDYVLVLYSLDTIINIICLWLTFNFSDKYYNKYFCGRCCTKCCFPIIKMSALSCNEYELKYTRTHNMNNCFIGNKCWIYCRCCCGCSCRYQWCGINRCCTEDITPKEIYTLAKYEIDLMVAATKKEKSLTMENMSNHSQKDVMSSQLEPQTSVVSFKE